MKRSSTTRNYIGAVDLLVDLLEERGAFDSEEAFHEYWRHQPVRRRTDPGVPATVEPRVRGSLLDLPDGAWPRNCLDERLRHESQRADGGTALPSWCCHDRRVDATTM